MSALGDYYHAMGAAAQSTANAANVGAQGQAALHHAQAGVQHQLADAASTSSTAQMVGAAGRANLDNANAAQAPGLADSENRYRDNLGSAATTNAGANVYNSQTNRRNEESESQFRQGPQTRSMDAGTEGVTRGNAPESFPYTAPKASSSDDDKYATGTSRIKAPGDGTVDTTKARLANGEAVLNRGAAEHLGQPAIQALNAVGMMRMGMVPGKGTQDDRVAPANKAQTAGKTGAQGYAKGTSKAGPKGKSAPPAKADAKGGKADAKGKPSDTPSIDQIDPKMLAAVAQMGVLGQQAGGPDMQAAQAAQAGAAPGQTPMGMPPGAAQQPPQGGPPMGMM